MPLQVTPAPAAESSSSRTKSHHPAPSCQHPPWEAGEQACPGRKKHPSGTQPCFLKARHSPEPEAHGGLSARQGKALQ